MTHSERQEKIYNFISRFTGGKGRPPTIREIGGFVGIRSTSVVNYNLNILVREGLIQRDKDVSRGLRVVAPSSPATGPLVHIPLLGKIAAGHPIPVPGEGLTKFDGETLSLTRDVIEEQEGLFALIVKGDSMIDALINDGDIVVMKKQDTAQNGEMVAVWLKDERATTLKRIYHEEKRIRLQPMNPMLRPRYDRPDKVQIQGKVVLVVRQVAKRQTK